SGGGSVLWKCKYCSLEKCTSYTRVEGHLLKKAKSGITGCDKVPNEVLCEMKKEVKRCQELVERAKTRAVSLPTGPSLAPSSHPSKKRGPASELEKSWAVEDRKHLDALIVRSIYSGGVSFNFLRNPYLQEAFSFACSRSLPGYVLPGFNRARETLLKQERRHIEGLLESTKSTWAEKGVTILSHTRRI
ncbi:unnamed protein product, partial [Urochloa humidicola]